MRILLINGSLSQKSHTLVLLNYLGTIFTEKGGEVKMWDLKTKPLPFVLPEYHKDPSLHPESSVREFVAEVEKAECIILGSPLYHGSYSGVLKNALDNLRADAFRGKWVGLVGNAGGLRASHVQFSHLRQVVNTLVGYTAQTQIGTCPEDYQEAEGKLVLRSQDMQQRCVRLVDELFSVVC